ncbi:type IV pilus assembly PilZ [Magnetococcus marinus MC-1]|uniref:Type IV pilus assembly PilZ n=1 Tax=Magnetococcus marinus (strain ATCC BAA-1437 / JCM 17883 / MC-1) TaxID=156889 RepID=A0L7G3_MAGMM|nr:PilZ domain-containing protein [Magnetococcus marinus]ABK43906.1 type IV pilus assembly PilZ [Magnetococcus marinus MC-1]
MTVTPGEEQSLRVLLPFYKQYAPHFVRHFFTQIRRLHGDAAVDKNHAPAAGYLYYKHFYPGINSAKLPPINNQQKQAYEGFIKQNRALAATMKAMEKDLQKWLELRLQRQLEAFKHFNAVAFKEVLSASGLDDAQVQAAEDELQKNQGKESITAKSSSEEKTSAPKSDAQSGAARLEDEEASVFVDDEEAEEQEPRVTPIEALKLLMEQGGEPACFNIYKGVPISYNAKIVSILEMKGNAVLKLHKFQSFVVGEDRSTLIKDSMLPAPIRADVVFLNREKQEVELKNLTFTELGAGDRNHIRVKPKDPVNVVVLGDGRKLSGELLDISATGMGVVCGGTPIPFGEPVECNMVLEKKGQTLRVSGSIVAVKEWVGGKTMLGVSIKPDTSSEVFISQFVYQRQAEVVREIQQRAMSLVD